MRENSLSGYVIRDYCEEDREAAGAIGLHVIDHWYSRGPGTSLHLVAEEIETGAIIGHAQAVDCSVPAPSRRPGQCHFFIDVAIEHRRRGIGAEMHRQIEEFARGRGCWMTYTSYIETPDSPTTSFLKERGFEEVERFYPSHIDLEAFDPSRFSDAIARVERDGFTIRTYADVGDTPTNRRSLYELEQAAAACQPFREVEPYVPMTYEKWESEFLQWDPATLFVAFSPEGKWAGLVTKLEWYFTGVHPKWQGQGVATALKVHCLTEAKRRGQKVMETENHEENAAMLAINRKLGFVFAAPSLACMKRLGERPGLAKPRPV